MFICFYRFVQCQISQLQRNTQLRNLIAYLFLDSVSLMIDQFYSSASLFADVVTRPTVRILHNSYENLQLYYDHG